MGNPLVTIIIPVYNGSNYLRRAIDSALAQTYPFIEVIVVNDGSTDYGAVESIALSYGKRIRYFSKANGGVASALNHGISQMKGEYFSWLSHDDEYLPRKVEAQIEYILSIKDAKVVLYSDFEQIDRESRAFQSFILPDIPPSKFRLWLTGENIMHGCTLLIHRSLFDCFGLFDERLISTQDYDLWFKMARNVPFYRVPEILVRSRIHDGQGTTQLGNIILEENNRLYIKFIDQLLLYELGPEKPLQGRLQEIIRLARSFERRQLSIAYLYAIACAQSLSREAGFIIRARTAFQLSTARRYVVVALAKLERIIHRLLTILCRLSGYGGKNC